MTQEWLIAIFGPIGTAIASGLGVGGWKLIKLIREIHHQVFPNSGGSLFDNVTAVKTAIHTHDARFKAYQDADGVATFYADKSGRLYWTSTGIEDLFGQDRTPAALLAYGLFDFVVDDERGSVRRRWDSAFADTRPFDCNCEIRVPTAGGVNELIWVRVVATPVGDGEYSGYVRTIETQPLATG